MPESALDGSDATMQAVKFRESRVFVKFAEFSAELAVKFTPESRLNLSSRWREREPNKPESPRNQKLNLKEPDLRRLAL
nr:hypothetical protein [uncultured Campylobacter sp.]